MWYIAEIVMEALVDSSVENVVYTNFTLVSATSDEDAYEKALGLGREHEVEYENTDGEQVRMVFRGLHDLHPMDEPLVHGTELLYEESLNMTEAEIAKWVRSKERLGLFRPRERTTGGPNLLSKTVCDELETRFGIRREDL